ncbi:MAG: M24 family metallopeptidase, partial [Gammaproteobacteria bacterium]|nr:M24 family metallopeptidase [Gammaproteobacteria bacterium]
FLQAEQELDSRFFKIMKSVQGQPAAIHEWLRTQKPGTRFGADAKTLTLGQAERFRGALQLIKGELILIEENLVDVIRGPVPEMNPAPIRLQIEAHSGESSTQKLNRVRDRLKAEGATGIVLNVLDEIAWLLNIRGSDVDHNPLVISYLFLTQDAAYFYVNPAKVTPAVETYLNTLGVQLKPYPSLNQDLREATGKVWIDPATANLWMDLQIKKGEVFRAPSPIGLMKAIKNKVEQAGAIEAHRRDGLALVKFFHWLEHHWKGQTELSIMEKLESFRAQNEDFQDLSFTTIAGYAAHGAIIHYRATQETNSAIADQNLLLVDSGGQYLQGTTDVTRTVHLGQPTPEHRRMYTLVLKGHLALRHAVFCAGTRGEHLDALARLPLFKAYCNYNHGTGHGVGSYLCVHEGPARISTAPTTIALQPGMILSNEPGVYIDGHFGIRLENLVLVVE